MNSYNTKNFLLTYYPQESEYPIREWKPHQSVHLTDTAFKTDGSEPLEKLVSDIYHCFCVTAQEVDYNEKFYRLIYETKLPKGTEIYRFNDNCPIKETDYSSWPGGFRYFQKNTDNEIFPDTDVKLALHPLITYYDLFGMIGVSSRNNTTRFAGNYVIWQHPNTGTLTLKAKGNKLFFGYE